MPTLSVLSHAAAAACFMVLALLLALRWRGKLHGSLLTPAVLATVVWALVNVLQAGAGITNAQLFADAAKSLCWVLFLTRMLGAARAARLPLAIRAWPFVVATTMAAAAIMNARSDAPPGYLSNERVLFLGGLLFAIGGFVLVEQLVRNTRAGQLWAAKFIWLGAGSLFVYDIALFSASYVLGALQETLWSARGFAVACAMPLFVLGLARVKEFTPQVLMSQRLAFYTSSVFAAGVYLVMVSSIGFYVRELGGAWGDALAVVLAFVALVVLVAILFSATARAWLRVLLAKHLFPYKYDYRVEWLDLTKRLAQDCDATSLAWRTVDAFARLVRAGGGAIWVLRDGVLQPAAGDLLGRNPPAEPADSAFCRFLEEHEWIVDLDEVRAGSATNASVPTPEWLLARTDAWLAIPLLHDDRLVALVVVEHAPAQEKLSWEDLDLLRTAGRQAASYFALEIAGDALARERQFAAFSRFSAFMMHDLSNILAQQQLIVDNAARHRHNPAFIDDAIDTIQNTVRRMTRLLEQMKSGAADFPARRSVLVDVAERATRNLADRRPAPELVVEDSAVAAIVAAERLEHVLEHIIRNAQDATPATGSVRVIVRSDGNSAVIEVVDTGSGMDPEFVRERLFRPFDTTKGASGMGIGAFQTREFVRAAGGEVYVASAPGAGTSFVIRLPRA